MAILHVNNISKSFGTNQVINDLSFKVEPNQIYGFLGQNGAGKTTVMKMILGLQKIDDGSITVNNQQVTFGQTKTNKDIGYLADVPAFYDFMTASEYLKLCGKISKLDTNQLTNRITELLELVGLAETKVKIGGYSRGMRQRLGIAQALLHEPLLLICDEPTSALDPIGRKQILDILKQASNTTAIIFSTHILSDVERICDRVGILNDGNLVIDTDIQTLTSTYTSHKTEIEFATEEDLNQFKLNCPWQLTEANHLTIELDNIPLRDIYNTLTQSQLYPRRVESLKPTLEAIFLEVTNV